MMQRRVLHEHSVSVLRDSYKSQVGVTIVLKMHCYVDESYVFGLKRRLRQVTLFCGR